jgi:hypothetical protein
MYDILQTWEVTTSSRALVDCVKWWWSRFKHGNI